VLHTNSSLLGFSYNLSMIATLICVEEDDFEMGREYLDKIHARARA
jgi:hypothetical protein